MKITNLYDINTDSCEVILDKLGRVVDGISHGRQILYDRKNNLYYKIFDEEYCRRSNFEKALRSGFFEELAPALHSVIVHPELNDDIIGYVTEAGQSLSNSEFDINLIPDDFKNKLFNTIEKTNLFFYDFVPSNIVRLDNGKFSLIDLESIYEVKDLFKLYEHNAKVKPDYLYDFVYNLWRNNYMRPISFIQPSRNNLKYLKWSYNSIRKNLDPMHEICWADDFSTDGTWEWMQEIVKKDPNVKIHRNEGPKRLGHTILYDTLINDYATNDVVMIYHADMYALPGLDEEVFRYIDKGVVVSATRIEPPLHPPGPEKILADYGIEPEEFEEQRLLNEYESFKKGNVSTGVFAPWAIYKSDFQSIGGHDPLYAPQSKEDSDIFNRFKLAGYKFIQTWDGFVYHMTCRGSRFADGAKRNPTGEVFMKNRETDEWLQQNNRSTRNFIRKWGHFVKHDQYLNPTIPSKYDIGFVVKNCSYEMLYELEPWCSTIYVSPEHIAGYIGMEQDNTLFNLKDRVKYTSDEVTNDVVVEFDVRELTPVQFQYVAQLPEIIKDSGEVGEMELGIFKIIINKLETYEKENIINSNSTKEFLQ